MGGVQNSSGNSRAVGGGGYFTGQKMEIPGRRGSLREIPSVVGVWIFSGTTHYLKDTKFYLESKASFFHIYVLLHLNHF